MQALKDISTILTGLENNDLKKWAEIELQKLLASLKQSIHARSEEQDLKPWIKRELKKATTLDSGMFIGHLSDFLEEYTNKILKTLQKSGFKSFYVEVTRKPEDSESWKVQVKFFSKTTRKLICKKEIIGNIIQDNEDDTEYDL